MRISISGKGVHRREVAGIEKLRELPSDWYAFTNLELIRQAEMPRQLDVAIVLDDRILIADLKDWRGKITSDSDRWFQNGRSVDTSPVKKILENARILAGLLGAFLRKYASRMANPSKRWELPLIEGCVILTNRCDISGISDLEKPRVFTVDEFCRVIQNSGLRAARLAAPKWIDKADPLTAQNSKWRGILSEFFGVSGGYFRPLENRYGDYRVISDITYQHPKQLYSEYDVEEDTASRASGLLRLWDFSKASPRYSSEESRTEIAGREQNVISYLLDRIPDLETVLIRPKVSDSQKGIHYWEVFERRRQLSRIQNFLTLHSSELTPLTRIGVARVLISHIAALHRLGAAHLDIGDHSVWIELPSSVRISHLVAASYPELTSLGDKRFEFLGSGTLLPEAVLGDSLDHFRKDVFLLGVVVHSILFGSNPKCSAGNPPEWDSSIDPDGRFDFLHEWFEKALDVACAERFSNAQEMLDSFNSAIKESAGLGAALTRLQRFRKWKSALELYRSYPVVQVLKETERVIMWVSEADQKKVIVKAWRRICWGDETQECPRILNFCEAAERLISTPPIAVAPLLDVGFISDHLVVIQEFIDGPNLAEDLLSTNDWKEAEVALRFIRKVAEVVTDLHGQGLSHGDLKPANILVKKDGERREPVIVDIVDFGPLDEGEIRTPKYAPLYPTGKRERDRFAVLTIAEEILTSTLIDDGDLAAVKNAISTCMQQLPSLATIAPLVEAITNILQPPPARPMVTVLKTYNIGAAPFVSDEGKYHATVQSDTRVTLTGATEELVIRVSSRRPADILEVHRHAVSQSRVAFAQKKAIGQLDAEIVIETGVQDFSGLSEFINSILAGGSADTAKEIQDAEPIDSDSVADSLEEDALADPCEVESTAPIKVPALWKTLIEVEGEYFTEGVAEADSYYSRQRRRHFVPFLLRKGTIDFTREDKVVIEVPNRSMRWVAIGILDLDLTRGDLIAVDTSLYRATPSAQFCLSGTELRLRSMMETDSRSRRNAATARILARRSVIPNLIDYFDPRVEVSPKQLDIDVDVDSIKKTYGLNDSQSKAFRNLWKRRPLGLLQGPPGTGKTKFIASLIHFALSTGVVRNVLLASQSHEAVNNASENVLALFRKENAEPSLIRVGQEIYVSDLLKPYHSARVEAHYREQFRAGIKGRLGVVGRQIGLSQSAIEDLYHLEMTIRPVFQRIQALAAASANEVDPSQRDRRVEALRQTINSLCQRLLVSDSGERDWRDPDAFDELFVDVASRHKPSSPDSMRRFQRVSELSRDWIGSVTSRRRSFEEFLAKTRQIVCGTCVGLGRSSLGLTTSSFDLVVIDEAARCTPSELAVPMQAGRWLILVGDHHQLDPFHQPIIVREVQRRLAITSIDVIRSDFERAFGSTYGKSCGEMLQTQYRMLSGIGSLVSDVFYQGTLQSGRKVPVIPTQVYPEFLTKELTWIQTDKLGGQAFQAKPHAGGTSLVNKVEANAIADFLVRLDEHEPFIHWLRDYDDDRKPIGIICTYAAQRELVRQKLRTAGLSNMMLNACKIDTVDSYQGKENPIVILSLVRNNEDGPNENGAPTVAQGYMRRPNRINVALSRAMDRLVIVGRSQRWPVGGPMFEVTRKFSTLASEDIAQFVDAAGSPSDESAGRAIRRAPSIKGKRRPK